MAKSAKKSKRKETPGPEASPGVPEHTGAIPAPAPTAKPRLRVLFIHPSYPNQFTALAGELNKDPAFDCYGMVLQTFAQAAGADRTMRHFAFAAEGETTPATYPYAGPFEAGVRNARGIARSLFAIKHAYPFDAIVGHASFGATLYLPSVVDAAVISYAELPGYQCAAGRDEYPVSLDLRLAGHACEALIYASMAQSDACIVPSEHARQYYPAPLQPMIRVQPEGFDADSFPRDVAGERAALGYPADGNLVGFFARTLEAVRGFDVFVKTAQALHATDPSLRFIIIGDDTSIYGNETRYLAGQSFMAHVLAATRAPAGLFYWRKTMPFPEFRRHLACLDLAILPTFEGAANWSIFEAMAAGLPIVASNRCFLPEIIRDGQEGILLDPDNVDSFVDAARSLLADPNKARSLGDGARQRIREDFSVAKAAAGYADIIRQAVATRREAAGAPGSRKPWGATPARRERTRVGQDA